MTLTEQLDRWLLIGLALLVALAVAGYVALLAWIFRRLDER